MRITAWENQETLLCKTYYSIRRVLSWMKSALVRRMTWKRRSFLYDFHSASELLNCANAMAFQSRADDAKRTGAAQGGD